MYLASRNEIKVPAAISKIHEENPKVKEGNLIWLPLELAHLENVHEAAQTFLAKEDRLDILGSFILTDIAVRGENANFISVNNAGTAAHSYQKTSDGFEVAMGIK